MSLQCIYGIYTMVSPVFVFIFTVANIYVYCMFLVYLIIFKNEKKKILKLISFLDLIQKKQQTPKIKHNSISCHDESKLNSITR